MAAFFTVGRRLFVAGLAGIGLSAARAGRAAAGSTIEPIKEKKMSKPPNSSEGIRVFAMLKRRADLDLDAFSRHWRTRHAEASLKLTKFFDRYVQNHLAAQSLPGFGRDFDGAAELWYPSWAESAALAESEEYRSDAYHDNFKFQDVPAMRLVVCRAFQKSPSLARPAPSGQVKAVVFWRRAASASADAFRERFMARATPLLLPEGRYTAFERCICEPVPGETEATFDGVEQLWWPTQAALASDLASLARPGADEAGLVDRGRSTAARVEELYIYWP